MSKRKTDAAKRGASPLVFREGERVQAIECPALALRPIPNKTGGRIKEVLTAGYYLVLFDGLQQDVACHASELRAVPTGERQ